MIKVLNSIIENLRPAFANHLLQSTVFAAIIGLLTLSLGRNRARVRYRLWLVASVKFVIPFSLLIALGSLFPKQPYTALTQPVLSSTLQYMGRSFSAPPIVPGANLQDLPDHPSGYMPFVLALVWLSGTVAVFLVWYVRWRKVSASLEQAAILANGREAEILHKIEALARLRSRLTMVGSPHLMEPGVFGVFRPVMLWPLRLTERLEDQHIESIIVHELMHVRRHDNLTAAIHMAVEAVFWFNPIVWWIGSRLMQERERACDEGAVQLLGIPEVYAESLLKACRFCVESPVLCVSGIAGADLRKRIVRIMTECAVQDVTPFRRLLLGTVAFVSLTVPVLFGVVRAAGTQDDHIAKEGKRLNFAVVSIRQNKTGGPQNFGRPTPDGYEMKNMFLAAPILTAYVPQSGGASIYSDTQVIGLPAWSESDEDRYDIGAKVDQADLADWQNPGKQPEMLRAMLQSMLADRLKLAVHRSTKEGPVYSLMVAKNGPRFKESNPAESHPGAYPFPGGGMLSMDMKDGEMTVHYFGISIGQLTILLPADRTIQDRTGLIGKYDITLRKPIPAAIPPGVQQQQGPPPEPELSAFSLAEQVGLKLEPAKGQVETLVIDHVERPSEN